MGLDDEAPKCTKFVSLNWKMEMNEHSLMWFLKMKKKYLTLLLTFRCASWLPLTCMIVFVYYLASKQHYQPHTRFIQSVSEEQQQFHVTTVKLKTVVSTKPYLKSNCHHVIFNRNENRGKRDIEFLCGSWWNLNNSRISFFLR